MASSSAVSLVPSLGFSPVSEKLTRANYQAWSAQVLSVIKGAQLYSFIKSTTAPPPEFLDVKGDDKNAEPKPNPEYDIWVAKDQQVLSFILSNLGKEILAQVSLEKTAAAAWAAIEAMHASQSRARIIATRMALATATKGSSSVADYFGKMKGLADEMASAGRKLEDDELVSYILTELDLDFNPVVSAVSARVEPITVAELYTQLTSFEQRMEIHGGGSQSSANMAAKGGRGGGGNFNSPRNRNGGGRGGFGRGGRGGRGNGGRGPNFQAGVFCQLCGKEGHSVIKCYKCFDPTFTGPPQKSAAAATASYGVDTNWYVDSGATDHVTGDLEKLTVRDKYGGHDQVHMASGKGMEINHVGSSILHTHTSKIHLNNILHVPQATKSLLSVNCLARDNNAFLEFHPDHFFIKQQGTRRTLLQGRCEGGSILSSRSRIRISKLSAFSSPSCLNGIID